MKWPENTVGRRRRQRSRCGDVRRAVDVRVVSGRLWAFDVKSFLSVLSSRCSVYRMLKQQSSRFQTINYYQLHYSTRRFDFSGAERQDMTYNVVLRCGWLIIFGSLIPKFPNNFPGTFREDSEHLIRLIHFYQFNQFFIQAGPLCSQNWEMCPEASVQLHRSDVDNNFILNLL